MPHRGSTRGGAEGRPISRHPAGSAGSQDPAGVLRDGRLRAGDGAAFTITTEPRIGHVRAGLHRLRRIRPRREARRPHSAGRWRHRVARRRKRRSFRAHRGGLRRHPSATTRASTCPACSEYSLAHREGLVRFALRPDRRHRHGGALLRPHRRRRASSCATGWAAGRCAIVAKIEKPEAWDNIEPFWTHRRRDGGARRPGRRDCARKSAAHSEIHHPPARRRKAGSSSPPPRCWNP